MQNECQMLSVGCEKRQKCKNVVSQSTIWQRCFFLLSSLRRHQRLLLAVLPLRENCQEKSVEKEGREESLHTVEASYYSVKHRLALVRIEESQTLSRFRWKYDSSRIWVGCFFTEFVTIKQSYVMVVLPLFVSSWCHLRWRKLAIAKKNPSEMSRPSFFGGYEKF